MSDVPEIDITTLEERLGEGVLVVDVREDDEYVGGHVAGAVFMPLGSVPDRVGELPTDAPFLVICQAGGRSARAVQFLRAQGLDATNVAGGTGAWVDSGRPVVTGPGPGLSADVAPEYRFVDTDSGFAAVIDALRDAPAYALDTEFHRERTYYPKLALVQLAWPGELVLVDPLAVDMAPSAEILRGPAVAVLHAADQDLEILELVCGTVPATLFDTQVAAGFTGLSTPSLATVYEKLLGVKVGKGDRLTDWLHRPLTDDQLVYAANDVAHLLEVHDLLVDDLRSRGRLQWALDECELQRVRGRGQRDPEEVWRRIKEARQLKGKARGVARSVAAWRERRAATLDIPVRYVLSDIAVVGIAQRPPRNRAELERIRGFDKGMREEAVKDLLAAVKAGVDGPVPASDDSPAGGLDRDLRPAVALISAWVAQLGRDLHLDAGLLATRGDLEALLRGDPTARLAEGWRAEIVGEPIRRLLNGEAAVAFAGDGELVIEERSNRPLGLS